MANEMTNDKKINMLMNELLPLLDTEEKSQIIGILQGMIFSHLLKSPEKVFQSN